MFTASRQQRSRLFRDASNISSTSSQQGSIIPLSRSASEHFSSDGDGSSFSEIRHEEVGTPPLRPPYFPDLSGFVRELDTPTPANALYLKYEKHIVEHFAALPSEVEVLLRDAGEQCQGSINCSVGYAAVWSLTDCYVWDYKKDHEKQFQRRMPTCYKFPMPTDGVRTRGAFDSATPFVCIVPPIDGVTPGLLACSLKGNFRYWDDVSLALTDIERYKSLDLYLHEDDCVTCLDCYEFSSSKDGNVIIVGTAKLNLSRIIVRKEGTSTLESSVLPRNPGYINPLLSSVFGRADKHANSRVVATTLGRKLERKYLCELFVLTEKTLELYALAPAPRPHKFISTSDIHDLIASEIRESDPKLFEAISSLDLKLLDIEYSKNGELVILVSSSVRWNEMDDDDCLYSLVTIGMDRSENAQYRVVESRRLKFPSSFSLSAKPRLVLPNGGPSVFVISPEAVIITALVKGADYNETMTMRDSRRDKLVGYGYEKNDVFGRGERESVLHVLTSRTGVMSCRLRIGDIVNEAMQRGEADEQDVEIKQARLTQDLKIMLERAVFYHNQEHNPLQPYLSADQGGDLNLAALELSEEILDTSSKYLDDSIDLKYQLNDRLIKMTRMVEFIGSCGRLNQLTTATLTRLFWNGDKIACAKGLWDYQNNSYAKPEANRFNVNLLEHAIKAYFHDRNIEAQANEDLSRQFYKYHVRDVGNLFVYVEQLVAKFSDSEDKATLMYQANSILLTGFREAFEYRKSTKKVYGLTETDDTEAWSSKAEIAIILRRQLESTEALVLDISERLNQLNQNHADDAFEQEYEKINTLKDQMVDLADVFFGITLDQFSSPNNKGKLPTRAYRDGFTSILKLLVTVGKEDSALRLAETYEDFRTLVELSLLYEKDTNAHINSYINKFGQRFAYVLYDCLLEQGKLQELLNRPHAQEHKQLLQQYLNERKPTQISWLHDIYCEDYKTTAEKLYYDALSEQQVHKTKTMLSISKLSILASIESKVDSREIRNLLREVECRLDFLNCTAQNIQKNFTELLSKGGMASADLNAQIDAIMRHYANEISESKPAFAKLYMSFIPKVLCGQLLSIEDYVDCLTLQDKQHEVDFARLIRNVAKFEELPKDRARSTVQSIWRRLYLHDRWEEISDTNKMSDEDIGQTLRQTTFYRTVSLLKEEGLNEWFYSPNDAYFSSPLEELQRRFSNMTEEELHELVADYKQENEALKRYIDEFNLLTYVNETL